MKFHENMSSGFKVAERHENCEHIKGKTPKVGKPELRFMSSARCLTVSNIYVKFHENMSSGFKFMEWTQKLTHKGQ